MPHVHPKHREPRTHKVCPVCGVSCWGSHSCVQVFVPSEGAGLHFYTTYRLATALKVSFSTRLPADTSHRTSLGPTTPSLDFLPQVLRRRRVSLFSPHSESLPFPESVPMQKKGEKNPRLIQQLGYNLPLKGDHSSHKAKIEGIAHGRSHQAGVSRDTTWRRL